MNSQAACASLSPFLNPEASVWVTEGTMEPALPASSAAALQRTPPSPRSYNHPFWLLLNPSVAVFGAPATLHWLQVLVCLPPPSGPAPSILTKVPSFVFNPTALRMAPTSLPAGLSVS